MTWRPRRFVKRPVEIEAAPWTGCPTLRAAVLQWVSAEGEASVDPTTGDLLITTLEGVMRAREGDWVIRGVRGEFYPCKPDVFKDTYDWSKGAEQEEKAGGLSSSIEDLCEQIAAEHDIPLSVVRGHVGTISRGALKRIEGAYIAVGAARSELESEIEDTILPHIFIGEALR